MVKLIIFDLDGVLVEAKKIHYDTLNLALEKIDKKYIIEWDDHLSTFDGLKTNQKLMMLTQQRGLPINNHKEIWDDKQNLTLKALSELEPNKKLIKTMFNLVNDGYKIVCCSNSIRKTVLTVLSKLGIIEFFDYILSNEDVKNSKPHPEMYWKAMSFFGCIPSDVVIFEDYDKGCINENLIEN